MTEKQEESSPHLLVTRTLDMGDYDRIVAIMHKCYPMMKGDIWLKSQIKKLIRIFPEGQLCVEDRGEVVAFALSIIVDYKKYGDSHSYEQIIDDSNFGTHTADGDVLYGIDVCVDPDYRGMRLGRRLYDMRKELCENLNLRSIVAGGRIPNYHKYKDQYTPKEYIQKVRHKEIYDPVLYFQMSNDFHVRKILKNYIPYDKASGSYAVLIEWNNIYYNEDDTHFGNQKNFARIGAVQWQLRAARSIDSFFENVEFFVDAVSGYQADFLVFPELFNAPLMAEFNEDTAAKAIRKLAQYSNEIRDKMVEYAVSYNINIIAGSMPVYEDENLYNVSYLCRRDGSYEAQYKIHVTPAERNDWGMIGGDKVQVFETDTAKIGILICYDSEFPELSRILADQGMEILFVPFATDMHNGYNRVRVCSMARAIENECYVVISGSVGNLPKVVNMDIQYGQSAVFSPSDFAFPHNAIVSEGTPNTENTIIADVDLNDLKHLHMHGSVRNLLDRREDLYKVKFKK
ncbi:bifunctional GNAT family N-acetyltransferase/carbon-nitrogen hydrolase family protein [Fulvivirga sediminis]|uniref:Bifunctional GNAT family N-acetyltransferase/carbon-nitrogen hydrolase family protein n=1 Tax=Fulvivirga sediminis TaxID=2803949 RepID=A0A937K207_9BACT|nr:bifunctional GNAT family N-acetyltransferase/carbon-nitrogen hydrolase family protein [Fulvivirga sediminis]MBL3658061.1 bifunctional GNAT family N-acetyltransferase/carbon-nitrogen hydrolase family protein [Fulvivirga sediminis]